MEWAIRERFSQSNGPLLFQLEKETTDFQKGMIAWLCNTQIEEVVEWIERSLINSWMQMRHYLHCYEEDYRIGVEVEADAISYALGLWLWFNSRPDPSSGSFFWIEKHKQIMGNVSVSREIEANVTCPNSNSSIFECSSGQESSKRQQRFQETFVTLPDGTLKSVTKTSSISLHPNLHIDIVLYVPEFKYNLLSVTKLLIDLHLYGLIYPDKYVF